MRIHQLLHTLSYGDAISGEVLALQRCLRELGVESEIYAINIHPKYKGRARDYRELDRSFDGKVILHYSLGSPLNDLYRSLTSATRVLVYHNITPPEWFEGVNPRVVRDIKNGLADLSALCRESDRLLSDSQFNADELAALGFSSDVLELPIDPARWTEEANGGISSLLKNDPVLHLLHVGRVAKNKKIEDVIKVFYFLHHHLEPRSKLWLVGIDTDTEIYSFALKRMVYQLRLDKAVSFTGGMSDSEVRAFYENASVYLTMSEHEGFCLPVIEAMNFGLPVVAYAQGALPATVGDGGVIINDKNPAAVAELVLKIHQDQGLKEELKRAGRSRVAELSYDRFKERVKVLFQIPGVDALGGCIGGSGCTV